MLTERTQRGRPRGTGIDDSAVLLEVARRVAADPRLKPTTAIKAVGITDPSAIRRLRDKLRTLSGDLVLDTAALEPADADRPSVSGALAAPSAPAAVPAPQKAQAPAAARCMAPSTPAAPTPPELQPAPAADPLAQDASASGADAWLVGWMSFGINAFNAALQAQQLAAQQLLRLPQFAVLMRQHVTFSEMALALCTPRTPGRFSYR